MRCPVISDPRIQAQIRWLHRDIASTTSQYVVGDLLDIVKAMNNELASIQYYKGDVSKVIRL